MSSLVVVEEVSFDERWDCGLRYGLVLLSLRGFGADGGVMGLLELVSFDSAGGRKWELRPVSSDGSGAVRGSLM